MEGSLKGLFGGGEVADEHKQAAADFANRVTTGDPTQGYTEEEAATHFQAAVQHASPQQLQAATEKAVNNLNPDQRAQFAEMLKQRQAGQGLVNIQQAGGTATDPNAGATGGGGIDDILGGLLGGAGGGGLGGLLGGLLGGGDQAAQPQTGVQQGGTVAADQGGGAMGGLGDILKSPI